MAGGDIFVADPLTQSIADVNDTSNSLRGNITLAGSAFTGIYVNSTGEIYSLEYAGSGTDVAVINPATDQVSARINTGVFSLSLQYDNSTNQLFVVDMTDSSVAVINLSTNQVTGYISVGFQPGNELYDALNGNLYVCNMASGTLSVIQA